MSFSEHTTFKEQWHSCKVSILLFKVASNPNHDKNLAIRQDNFLNNIVSNSYTTKV